MTVTDPRFTVTLQGLAATTVEVTYDKTDDAGRRLVSLDIGNTFGSRVQFLDELPAVAELVHRADVLLQARLQMAAL